MAELPAKALFELLPPPERAPDQQPVVGGTGDAPWLLLGGLLLAALAWMVGRALWRRSLTGRLHRLGSAWRRGRISSRQLLHQLADTVRLNDRGWQVELDRLRFAPPEPDAEQVHALLRRAGRRTR